MTWIAHHTASQEKAASAHSAMRSGDTDRALELFAEAATEEALAIDALGDDKPRTLGVSVVSAAALWYKARKLEQAEQLAYRSLGRVTLPLFAQTELQGLLQAIWNERAQQEAGISFVPGQVKVAVRGGDVVRGGAPLDLILNRVQIIQSMFYRTAEFLKSVPFRKKGPPSKQIQANYKPWLFQSVPGSYQFIVAIQKSDQLDMFPGDDPEPEFLTETFLSILSAATDSSEALTALVPDTDYRETFLKLTRNLAPTGKAFDELEIRGTSDSASIKLSPYSRRQITNTIRPSDSGAENNRDPQVIIRGTLRAVHLEKDWLEVIENGESKKVTGVGEAVDDLIGPMVNHQVIVRVRKGKKNSWAFIDIEQEE